MPKIGLRILKSAAAVFLCFVIYLLRGKEGVPFYSAIAAILCMQPYVSNSIKTAWNRTVGTLIGGVSGLLILLIERFFLPPEYPILQYLLISASIIPIIYVTVLIKKTPASYITCVVFLSVTVSHGADVSPWFFALNRVIDTLIGIFVSLGVNAVHLPKKRNSRLLFVSALEEVLLPSGGAVSPYSKVRLNRLTEHGAKITFASGHAPAEMLSLLDGIELRLPLVVLHGAALYDSREMRYSGCQAFAPGAQQELLELLCRRESGYFAYAVMEDLLHVFCPRLSNPAQRDFYEHTRNTPHRSYVLTPLPDGQEILFLLVIDQTETIRDLRKEIEALPHQDALCCRVSPTRGQDGFHSLEITSAAVREGRVLNALKAKAGAEKTIVFGANEGDIPLLRQADLSFAMQNASDEVKRAAVQLLPPLEKESVPKAAGRLFYGKKLPQIKNGE